MCLWKRERTYLFLPFVTTLVRQPHYTGDRCADGDHLQDARSQGCEDDTAVCESAPKESASFHDYMQPAKAAMKEVVTRIIGVCGSEGKI